MARNQTIFDYIIVGAGSAGCVLASRLTEDPKSRVLLLEAGGPDRSQRIHIPAAFSKLFKSPLDWNYETEPEFFLHNRRLYWPRGKMLGGSSSINAMIYIRGNPLDYDEWESFGNAGWKFQDVLPYFKKSENQARGPSEYHGSGGLLNISDLREVNKLTQAFLAACESAGLVPNGDFNGPGQDGVGLYQVTQKNGRRHSAADAYLRPALGRKNLVVLTGAHALRILVEHGRTSGVSFCKNGLTDEARAEREVILSGGTISSPQLLLLSGVGPADDLKGIGIDPVVDLPGVGKNLQDHLMVSTGYLCKQPVSLMSAESIPNMLRYFLFRSGPLTSNVAEAGLFHRTRRDLVQPNLQVLFGPAYYVCHGFKKRKDHCFGFAPTIIKPQSRGTIALRSADPLAAPAIRPNYLSCDSDLDTLIEGVKLTREIAHAPAFEPYRGQELHPGVHVTETNQIAEFIRNEAETLYHPVGTCKMGNDSLAVVDPFLRVRGIENLRVVDASVMPRIIGGNTNAPTIMIAEKAADMIRGIV
jgi:choline dehydrogenase